MRAELERLTDEVAQLRRALPPLGGTNEDAARVLGRSVSTIKRLRKAGRLPLLPGGRIDLAALRPTHGDDGPGGHA
jgi:hypothetical protein